ncbi:putative guanine deaminase [Leucoagaricus sp. SymC.cos]|nr:putative guanine deaminase [Leucoagaricus sp. SymC.cos]
MSGFVTILYGSVVTPVDPRTWKALPRCLMAIGSTGNIDWMLDHVEENKLAEALSQKGYSTDPVVKLRNGEFIIPGFVDTHTHAAQFPNAGKGGQYELLDWLNNVTFPKEAEFVNLEFAKEVYYDVVRRSLASGTTTSCYYATLHLEATKVLADAVNQLGQRAFIGKCNMDRKKKNPEYYIEKSTEQSLEDTTSLISYVRSLVPISSHASIGTAPEPLVQPILTPRFAISCTRECLFGLRDLADHHDKQRRNLNEPRMRIQTHISENRGEIKHTLNLYPDAKSYAQVYDDHGLLRDTTALAHAVHLTEDEIQLIKERKAGISHCPTSNFNLRSGVAPIGRYLDEGLKVGLGTDVSGGYAVSMLNAIQNASVASKIIAMMNPSLPNPPVSSRRNTDNEQLVSPPVIPPSGLDNNTARFANRQLPIQTLLYLATLGGANVCSLSEKIGSFSPGKSFDALVISVLDETGAIGVWGKEAKSDGDLEAHRKKLEENLERFLFCGDDRNIQKVYVQGCLVGGRTFGH